MKGSDFVFNYVQLLPYKSPKINPNCGGSYIDFPDWIKSKKGTNNKSYQQKRCFQYAVTVALNHKKIKKDPQSITKLNFL